MRGMRRRWLLPLCAGVALLGACGAGDDAVLSSACTDAHAVEQALRSVPRPVVLDDGTRLSECFEQASTPADLQNLGAALTDVAEGLEADPARAEQLGYLIGAARRGTARGDGQGAELAHRLERSGAESADTATLMRGIRIGEGSG
jgi:hypothetical protein